MRIKRYLVLIGPLLLFSCFNDVERDNPLDPKAKNFHNAGSLSGEVMNFYAPFSPLAGAEVRLEPGPLLARTDAKGVFRFEDVPQGQYRLWASKPGYSVHADSLVMEVAQTLSLRIHLDALPVIDSVRVISQHISRWWPQDDLYILEVTAHVSDPDGLSDIETVSMDIPQMQIADTLQVTQTPGWFRTRLTAEDLQGRTVQETLGRNIILTATDRAGFSSQRQHNHLARVIETVPSTVAPTGLEIVENSNIVLTWKLVNLPFPFTYRVDVVRVDQGVNSPVTSIEGINKSQASLTITDFLAAGTYFWTVSVVDEFENLSRSKEAAFQTQ